MKTKKVCLSALFRQQKLVSEDSISSPKRHSAPLMLVISFLYECWASHLFEFLFCYSKLSTSALFKLARHYLLMIATNIVFILHSSDCHMHVVRSILWQSEGTTWACRLWHWVRINMFQFGQITLLLVSSSTVSVLLTLFFVCTGIILRHWAHGTMALPNL